MGKPKAECFELGAVFGAKYLSHRDALEQRSSDAGYESVVDYLYFRARGLPDAEAYVFGVLTGMGIVEGVRRFYAE